MEWAWHKEWDTTPIAMQSGLIRVTGIEGAKAYQMAPNSTVALFDNNNDFFYVKTTDGAGFPTIRTFKFEEIYESGHNVNSDYVSRKEMEDYVKQFIQKSESRQQQNFTANATSQLSKTEQSGNDIQSDVQF